MKLSKPVFELLERVGPILKYSPIPFLTYFIYDICRQNIVNGDKWTHERRELAVFMLVWFGTYSTLATAHSFIKSFFHPDDTLRTRFNDYSVLNSLKREILEKSNIYLPLFKEFSKIKLMLRHWIVPFLSKRAIRYKAEKTKDPFFMLISASIIETEALDDSLIHLRDILQSYAHKQPRFSFATKILAIPYLLFPQCAIFFQPRNPFNYILTAVTASILNPVRAWYYSELSRMVADRFESPNKLEIYILHAMLASAQRRSDENDAWNDAFGLIQKVGKQERLGESRNPVWQLTNRKFFSQTFVFKGNKDRDALVRERDATVKLEEIVRGMAVVPQPIHITSTPHAGLYTYVMRYLPGTGLRKHLEEGDFSSLDYVVPALARILACYPTTDLSRISIPDKHAAKLASKHLNLPSDLQNYLKQNLAPVERAIDEYAIWRANKDAHAEQWIVLDDKERAEKIGTVDAEISNLQPCLSEAANLFAPFGKLDNSQTQSRVVDFARYLREEGARISDPELRTAYTDNTVLFRSYHSNAIHRLLSLIEAWSTPERQNMHPLRSDLFDRIETAIHLTERDDSVYFAQFKTQYDHLLKGIRSMRDLILT